MENSDLNRTKKSFMSRDAIFFYSLLFMYIFTTVLSEECQQINSCKCKFSNGSVIDLTSIGYEHEARFQNIEAHDNKSYTYYYNPCYPFSLGNSVCQNVAVCQVSKNNEYQNCGTQNDGFVWNDLTKHLNIIYTSNSNPSEIRTTNVTLICARDAKVPVLYVIGENITKLYEMTLTTRCACPDLCREDHLSAGSVLVIIFLIFLSLYLVLGIIHSSLTRGAQGWELIPHYEFWADFPLLVRDGCVFVMSGCKADTAYERI